MPLKDFIAQALADAQGLDPDKIIAEHDLDMSAQQSYIEQTEQQKQAALDTVAKRDATITDLQATLYKTMKQIPVVDASGNPVTEKEVTGDNPDANATFDMMFKRD